MLTAGKQFPLASLGFPDVSFILMSNGMALIREKRGMLAKVAHGLGLTRAAVVKWSQVPAERVVEIERITGIPREQLRPDIFERAGGCACKEAA